MLCSCPPRSSSQLFQCSYEYYTYNYIHNEGRRSGGCPEGTRSGDLEIPRGIEKEEAMAIKEKAEQERKREGEQRRGAKD